MKKIPSLLKNWNYVSWIIPFSTLFLTYICYSTLGQGMIFNDEAMYLFQFRDYKTTFTLATTHFFMLKILLYIYQKTTNKSKTCAE